MPTADALRERREKLLTRDRSVEKLIRGETRGLDRLLAELAEEEDERAELRDRRHELAAALEEEIQKDERGRGERPEQWEAWAESRRDELADLVDASEGRTLRLIERVADTRERRQDLRKRDRRLEKRIEIVEARIERKAEASGQLTPSFHVAEFDCHDGTPVPAGIIPALKQLCAEHLQPLRNSGGVVSINSGYRTRTYNASIGGASQSYHIYDLRMTAPAADHIQGGRSAPDVQQWHESHNPPDGMGFYAGFTHIDDRGYHSRWYGAA